MKLHDGRANKMLKMKPELFYKVEKKRKKDKIYRTFHELGIELLTKYSKLPIH